MKQTNTNNGMATPNTVTNMCWRAYPTKVPSSKRLALLAMVPHFRMDLESAWLRCSCGGGHISIQAVKITNLCHKRHLATADAGEAPCTSPGSLRAYDFLIRAASSCVSF